jgi:hypothetical protein
MLLPGSSGLVPLISPATTGGFLRRRCGDFGDDKRVDFTVV